SPKPCESDLNQNDTNRLIVPRAKGRYFGHTNPAAEVHSNGTFHTNGNNVNHAAQSDTDAALKTVQLKNLNPQSCQQENILRTNMIQFAGQSHKSLFPPKFSRETPV